MNLPPGKEDQLKTFLDGLAPGIVSKVYQSFRKSENIDDRRGDTPAEGPFHPNDGSYDPTLVPEISETPLAKEAGFRDIKTEKQLLQERLARSKEAIKQWEEYKKSHK